MGFVQSWKYLALCRMLLGAFEVLDVLIRPLTSITEGERQAGFFPALVFVITTW